MDNTIVKQIIEDAAKLAEQSVAAFQAQKKLSEVEPQLQSVSKKAQELETKIAEEQKTFKANVTKVAETLATRGILEEGNKDSFVEAVLANPSEIFNVVEKIAGELKAESFGQPGDLVSPVTMDPFERLVIEG